MEVSPWQDRVSKRLCLVQVTLHSISCTIFWFPIWIRLIQCWRKLWSQMQFNMDVSLVWYITTEMILLGPNNSFSHACLEYSILMLGFGVFDYASMMHHSLMYTDEIVISVSKSCQKRIIVEWVLRSQLCLCNSNVGMTLNYSLPDTSWEIQAKFVSLIVFRKLKQWYRCCVVNFECPPVFVAIISYLSVFLLSCQ